MGQEANRVGPDLALLVFVRCIMVNPPVVLLLEGMTTMGLEKDMTEMDIIMLSCNDDT